MVGNFIVMDNGIYFEEHIPGGMTNTQLMMTREAFVEAYEKWIRITYDGKVVIKKDE